MSPLFAQLGYYIALVIGLIGALFIGSTLGSEDYETVILVFLGVAGIVWVVAAKEAWWLPMPLAVGMGGVFYVPWKLFPHELALATCGVALLPRLFLKAAGLRKRRPPLPRSFYLLLVYLLAHATVCIFAFRGGSGQGNIARAYMSATWPLIFGVAFYWYGSTKGLRAGFALLYAAVVLRVGMGLYNIWQDDVLFVPGINYALDGQDIRISGNMLMVTSGLACVFAASPFARAANGVVAFASSLTWLALGGSRGQLVQTLAFVTVIAVVFRWRILLATMLVGATLVGVALNVSPSLMDPLPYQTQRALTVFLLNAPVETEVQNDVKGSGRFREVLSEEGYKRWSESPRTMVVGTGIRPFDESFNANAMRFEMEEFTLLIQSAADVGAYETGFWSMLAVTGIIGLCLCFAVFFAVSRRLFDALRTLPLRGPGKIFTAWALASLACYFLLCFVGGSFPSFELFLSSLAMAYLEDVRAAQRGVRVVTQEESLPEPPTLLPAGARA